MAYWPASVGPFVYILSAVHSAWREPSDIMLVDMRQADAYTLSTSRKRVLGFRGTTKSGPLNNSESPKSGGKGVKAHWQDKPPG